MKVGAIGWEADLRNLKESSLGQQNLLTFYASSWAPCPSHGAALRSAVIYVPAALDALSSFLLCFSYYDFICVKLVHFSICPKDVFIKHG